MSSEAFQILLKSFSPLERERIMKTAMAYGIGPEDPAWVILAINQSGLMAMEKAVAELKDVHQRELKAFEQKAQLLANQCMDKAASEAVRKISDTLAQTAQQLYRKRELKVTTSWTIGAAMIGIAFYMGTTLFTYRYIESMVYKKALNEAYQLAYDEKARASWANTRSGKLAFALSQTTDIVQLATCRKPGSGWRLNDDGTVCFPKANREGSIYGWGIPKLE